MITYDPPTYRRQNNATSQWQEWKRQAHAIGFDEAKRHSSVSTSNRHKCRECLFVRVLNTWLKCLRSEVAA